MPGLEDLYREIILDHYRTPRNRGELAPPAVHADRLAASLERAGVKTWELFRVASSDAAGAPLAIDGRDVAPDPVRGWG